MVNDFCIRWASSLSSLFKFMVAVSATPLIFFFLHFSHTHRACADHCSISAVVSCPLLAPSFLAYQTDYSPQNTQRLVTGYDFRERDSSPIGGQEKSHCARQEHVSICHVHL